MSEVLLCDRLCIPVNLRLWVNLKLDIFATDLFVHIKCQMQIKFCIIFYKPQTKPLIKTEFERVFDCTELS